MYLASLISQQDKQRLSSSDPAKTRESHTKIRHIGFIFVAYRSERKFQEIFETLTETQKGKLNSVRINKG
ncbi:hypothetical protein E2C01_041931 [Portunus trituberculatus]|uniref:Uncharacterized protein n=1 Tax=Portunus trituberculatus TaxID=210409 RepID=A0A5B7FT00_PORTR|nr:hypothetical protein [Portunus trituberculatus]